MNNRVAKYGFTIPEVLISLTILTMVIFTVTSLVVSIIRTNKENIDTLVAYGLAQEALEGIRNIRDSDWLLGAGFDGNLSGSSGAGNAVWGTYLNPVGDVLYMTIEPKKLFVGVQETVDTRAKVADVAPWELMPINSSVIDEFNVIPGEGDKVDRSAIKSIQINKYSNEDTGRFYYAHNQLNLGLNSGAMEKSETIYYRYVEIREVGSVSGEIISGDDGLIYSQNSTSGEENPGKMQVSAVVTWSERDRWKEVRLETVLTDWNTGR